jgi:hypothetical protein
MPPLPIDANARKQAQSLEARSARARRYSTIQARRDYYQQHRTIRFAHRLQGA